MFVAMCRLLINIVGCSQRSRMVLALCKRYATPGDYDGAAKEQLP
jgi:hypothetical protein